MSAYVEPDRSIGRRPVRQGAELTVKIPNNSEPGIQLYVSIIRLREHGPFSWVVGTHRWNDEEWDAGRYCDSFTNALRAMADRIDSLTK